MLQNGFNHYLYKREHIVSCQNQLSGKCQLRIGVPQGSVLGPLLFLIYVNDSNRHVHLGSYNLYADDTLIYCTGSNIGGPLGVLQAAVTRLRFSAIQGKCRSSSGYNIASPQYIPPF